MKVEDSMALTVVKDELDDKLGDELHRAISKEIDGEPKSYVQLARKATGTLMADAQTRITETTRALIENDSQLRQALAASEGDYESVVRQAEQDKREAQDLALKGHAAEKARLEAELLAAKVVHSSMEMAAEHLDRSK